MKSEGDVDLYVFKWHFAFRVSEKMKKKKMRSGLINMRRKGVRAHGL